MVGSRHKIIGATLCVALLGLPGAIDLAQAAEVLPRSDFPMCSVDRNTYCISEVTFIEITGEKAGQWIPSGTPIVDAEGAPSAATFPVFDKVPYKGRFSYPGFDVSRGYDGIYVRVGPANEFTDTMMIAVEPAGPGPDGQVGRVKDESTGRVQSLSPDMSVRVSVRLGTLIPALTVSVSNTAEVNKSVDGTTPVITFTGSPVPVPIQNKAADCSGEAGVAAAKPYQLFAVVVFENGRDPFGVPGLSGDILVSTNGVCRLTTPTWSAETLSFSFVASAPHFAPDGATVNRGFYRAMIPTVDAGILFGISNASQAATALDLVFEDTESGQVSVEKRVAVQKAVTQQVTDPVTRRTSTRIVRPEQIVIAFTNFQFSSPKMTVKVKSSRLKQYKSRQKTLLKKNQAINRKNKT